MRKVLRDYLGYDFMGEYMNSLELKSKINHLMSSRRYDEIRDALLDDKEITEHDNGLAVVFYL